LQHENHHDEVEAPDQGDQQWAQAFRHTCAFADQFARRLLRVCTPVDVAGAMIGAAVNVLAHALGKQNAVAYLHDLVREIEQDGGADNSRRLSAAGLRNL
jgi:hypothetical protein